MTNKLRTLLAFSAVGMSFATLPAFGGQSQTLRVNVPFAFTAGKTAMPAGEYTVYENEAHLVMIRGTRSAVMVLGAAGSDSQDDRSSLGFQRTSKGFLLRSVHASGRQGSILPVTVGEK